MNERNVEIQKMLRAEGLYKGKLDGIIGPVTRRALELHNKAQYQPLPPERPGPPTSLQGSVGTGIADPGAMAQLALQMDPAPPLPPPAAPGPSYLTPPSMGPATRGSAGWVRGGLNALLGREALKDPNQPFYAPQFTDQPSPAPMDQNALRLKMLQAQRTLGQVLSDAVVRQ